MNLLQSAVKYGNLFRLPLFSCLGIEILAASNRHLVNSSVGHFDLNNPSSMDEVHMFQFPKREKVPTRSVEIEM